MCMHVCIIKSKKRWQGMRTEETEKREREREERKEEKQRREGVLFLTHTCDCSRMIWHCGRDSGLSVKLTRAFSASACIATSVDS